MARMPDLERFAAAHGLMILTIADLIDYRLQAERLVRRVAEGPFRPAAVPEAAGAFTAYAYASDVEENEYLALVQGDVAAASERGEPVLVRVQSMCPVGDPFGSTGCDCEAQLRAALRAIAAAGLGVFLYVYPRARTSLVRAFEGHVLHKKDGAAGPPPGALREFGLGAQVLADLGLRKVRLLSNNPKKIAGIAGFGIEVVERVAIESAPASAEAAGWLEGRREREGYLLSIAGGPKKGE
jgi:3,4-dihydroxy 2-butanone 4-phosphate synthase/GTP cyclohydrolase II